MTHSCKKKSYWKEMVFLMETLKGVLWKDMKLSIFFFKSIWNIEVRHSAEFLAARRRIRRDHKFKAILSSTINLRPYHKSTLTRQEHTAAAASSPALLWLHFGALIWPPPVPFERHVCSLPWMSWLCSAVRCFTLLSFGGTHYPAPK